MTMQYEYLTDSSDRSLVPFFSPSVTAALFYGVLIVTGVLVVFWPWQDLPSFMGKQQSPLVFFQLSTAVLIIIAYVNLRCGRGEMVRTDYFKSYEGKPPRTFEQERNFFRYGLIGFLLHTLFLLLPFLPLLILATSLSGLSLRACAQACVLVFMTSLLCRVFGFVMYLLGGRASFFGYFFTRAFFVLVLFATAVLAPACNPILVLYGMNKTSQRIDVPIASHYIFSMAVTLIALLVFMLASQLLITYQRHKREKET
ncbi:hypothetical protein GF339_06820 [candidate division KSB3 bacterium]|uniref:Uncharacterized protein n=1 Tax=candidate division KSB3 bacterium TaxID=2044937 RepID=A0A9D5JU49_9BACT|nr:hypothetical protein [candidate division KSB3 bacterium]MBD3324279.1 hypothetical protein [candidate division KSB3 bacterium]